MDSEQLAAIVAYCTPEKFAPDDAEVSHDDVPDLIEAAWRLYRGLNQDDGAVFTAFSAYLRRSQRKTVKADDFARVTLHGRFNDDGVFELRAMAFGCVITTLLAYKAKRGLYTGQDAYAYNSIAADMQTADLIWALDALVRHRHMANA